MAGKQISPHLEISGAFLKGIVGSLNEESVAPIRTQYGFDQIDPDAWYSAQQVVNFFNDLEKHGGMMDMVAVGVNIGKSIPIAPEVDTARKALAMTS